MPGSKATRARAGAPGTVPPPIAGLLRVALPCAGPSPAPGRLLCPPLVLFHPPTRGDGLGGLFPGTCLPWQRLRSRRMLSRVFASALRPASCLQGVGAVPLWGQLGPVPQSVLAGLVWGDQACPLPRARPPRLRGSCSRLLLAGAGGTRKVSLFPAPGKDWQGVVGGPGWGGSSYREQLGVQGEVRARGLAVETRGTEWESCEEGAAGWE